MRQCQQQQRRHLFQQTDPLYHLSNRWTEAGRCAEAPIADPLPDADTPRYSGSGMIHDPIMMRFCWLG
jgi:hypothetical protein